MTLVDLGLPVAPAARPAVLDAHPEELRSIARRAGRALEGAPARDVLRWLDDLTEGSWAVASSMADGVLAHVASTVRPGVDVLFLDTGYHFAETLGTRDAVDVTTAVTVVDVRANRTVAEQDAALGPRTHAHHPDLCCWLRKVRPLDRALSGYAGWASGLRRADGPSRARTPVVDWDARRGRIKVNPLAAWSDDDVAGYITEHGVVTNPLLDDGYDSIGCAPCTRRTAPGEGARAGRWAGLAKTECGIHA